jgi:hypothetical protein
VNARNGRLLVTSDNRPIYLGTVKEDEYGKWNRALAAYCLLSNEVRERVCLAASPRVLAAAWAQLYRQRFSSEDAEKRFVAAVAELYQHEVAPAGLHVLGGVDGDGLPRCIAFLGLSVLAALAMSHEDYPAHAYYPRLSDLLGAGRERGYPRGFTPEGFKQLWRNLRRWLKEKHRIVLSWPQREQGAGHIVALPLSHAPLRRIDLQKLPAFFASCGYSPSIVASPQKLEKEFTLWAGGDRLTASGLSALKDVRRGLVLAQVTYELEAWDGSVAESPYSSWAQVELLLDLPRRQPQLFYWPRRPHAFPEFFSDEQSNHQFESCEEGWYDPVPIPAGDGPLLAHGFEWKMRRSSRSLILRRSETYVVALTPSPHQAGFASRRRLPHNIKCAVLCRQVLEAEVSAYLRNITGRSCASVAAPGLPSGWKLFLDVKPVHPITVVPPLLEPIEVETDVEIFPIGGLRVGKRQWIVGGPPRLSISGANTVRAEVSLDGERVDLDAEGVLLDNGMLSTPGVHTVVCAGAQLRIEVISPTFTNLVGEREEEARGSFVALPPGRWTVIGAASDELLHCRSLAPSGVVVRTRFRAVWAINRVPTVAAKVVCVATPIPPPAFPIILSAAQRQIVAQWADAVLSSQALRPRIGCFDEASGSHLRRVWGAYVAAARGLVASRRRSTEGQL